MNEAQGLRLRPSAAARQRRLDARLREMGRSADDPRLAEAVEDAQLLGSLQLAGIIATWDDVRVSRASGTGLEAILALRRARAAVDAASPFSVETLGVWHAAIAGRNGFRRGPRERPGIPPAPPELIPERLATLAEWLAAPSARELRPEQRAALVLARIVEILPFDDANGRVSRLAASHLMVAGGMRPPVLVGADRPRLVAAIESAFPLDTEPLGALLAEASDRALDVMVQALDRGL